MQAVVLPLILGAVSFISYHLARSAAFCRLLNPQIIVNPLQFRFGLALGNEHLFRKHCIYHLHDFIFTRQPYLLCQFSADISDMVFQRLHLGCPQLVVCLFHQRIFEGYSGT